MKYILTLIVFVSIATATEPQALADRYNVLVGGLARTGPSPEQYDAFRYLVEQGPEGWRLLFQAQCDTNFAGDAARKIDSFWETSGLSEELLDKFHQTQGEQIAKRASNETWAILYAAAYERTAHRARHVTQFERIDGQFESVRIQLQRPSEALMAVAYLRVMLVEAKSFPGHNFPWTAPTGEQKKALEELLGWWKASRSRYNQEEAEQDGTGQPATRSESNSEGSAKPQPDAEGRAR